MQNSSALFEVRFNGGFKVAVDVQTSGSVLNGTCHTVDRDEFMPFGIVCRLTCKMLYRFQIYRIQVANSPFGDSLNE